MCRIENNEFDALAIFKRANAAIKRGDKPSAELMVLVERWLSLSEQRGQTQTERLKAQASVMGQATSTQPAPADDRLSRIERKIDDLRLEVALKP